LDTRQLRAAIAVARYQSFTLAARELFMAQSTVTRQVASLERELGNQLFRRNARTVDLTDRGRVFIPKAQEVLDAVDRAVHAVRGR
jgi:DNA-binding transcriptional LysR family regulator